MTTLEKNLAYFNHNPKKFLRRFVSMDETWIYHYTLKSRKGSKQWVKPGESTPEKLNGKQKGISRGLTNRIIWKG